MTNQKEIEQIRENVPSSKRPLDALVMLQPTYKIFNEDWNTALAKIEPKSVQCCITSPPYWGQRNYGVEGQLGQERTPEEYIGKLVAGFSLLRNALADDGTCWINIDDTYMSGGGASRHWGYNDPKYPEGRKVDYLEPQAFKHPVIKPKDLCLIPQRLIIALQQDGWYVRCDGIWNKPNTMPESATDRPTRGHEYLFLITKKPKYYYNAEAVLEPYTEDLDRWGGTMVRGNYKNKTDQFAMQERAGRNMRPNPNGRNRRTVWNINTVPDTQAHFATFPDEIPRLCILAGTKEGQTILDPFAGSGTTGEVALRMKRNFIGIELNDKYVAKLITPKLENVDPLFRSAVAT